MNDELACLLASSLPDLVVEPRHRPVLRRLCETRRLQRNRALFRQGEPVPALYGVASGEIASQFVALDGRVSVLEHVGSGRLFGLSSFATGLPSTYDAVALRPTKLVVIGPDAYGYLIDNIPGFARGLVRELANRHLAALQQLEASRHHSPMSRLSLAIGQLMHSGRIVRSTARGSVLLRTTQAELAALAHISRQTANELIAELARSRRVKPVYGGLWVRPVTPRTAR
jgi:CRP/FNR family cyclic AMP-dependent transcriptional regulator